MTTDAERYAFLKAHFVRAHSLQMDGTASYRLSAGWPTLRGKNFDEAVDNAMQMVQEEIEKLQHELRPPRPFSSTSDPEHT
jgi:hypothetical protein